MILLKYYKNNFKLFYDKSPMIIKKSAANLKFLFPRYSSKQSLSNSNDIFLILVENPAGHSNYCGKLKKM